MPGPMEQLERRVTAGMNLLRDLPQLRPAQASVARVQAAVRAEAARLDRRLRPWRAVQSVVGLAAALLLALGWGLYRIQPPRPVAPDSDSAVLNAWVDAADESGRAVALLIDGNWPYDDEGGLEGGGDLDTELEDLFRSFEDLQDIGA